MKDIIKKLLKEDDLDWIGSVSNDYWDYYDAVVFKKTLFDDEFKKFINQALKSVQPTNASDWEEDDEMSDLEYLNYRIRRHGQAFIGKYRDEKGRNVLIFGQDPDYELYPQVKDAKTINYGDIKKGLFESDDFDWIKDVKSRLPLRVGTCLTFKHSKEEEEWVEDEYGNMIDHGKMNWHITSKFIDVYNDDKPTFSMVATDRMGEGRQIFMEVEKVKELYEEGVYEPCKKQPYLKRVMKEESDDFDWIKDTKVELDMEYLHGYYFRWVGDFNLKGNVDFDRKFWVEDISKNRVYYSWEERGERLSNSLPVSDIYKRFEDGDYILYDKNGNKIDPKNITWFNEGNDDEIGPKDITESSDDWNWTESPTVIIGGKGGYPKVEVKLGDKIIDSQGDVWVIEEFTPSEHPWVWGSGMKHPWLGPKNDEDNKNWNNPMWLRKYDENINESDDFGWIDNIDAVDPKKPKPGYVYNWSGYSDIIDDEEVLTDTIIITNIKDEPWEITFAPESTYPKITDEVHKKTFGDLIDKGEIQFLYKLGTDMVNESDDFDWARDTIPIELEDPKDWVGRSFGYGPEIVDNMDGAELAMGDDKEYFTIDSIDENGNLALTRHHPNRRSNSDSSTSVISLRDYISNGKWVWV